MDTDELINFAKAYRSMGDAVAEQLDSLLDGCYDDTDINPNAVDLIRETLGYVDEIDDACQLYWTRYPREA